MHQLLFVDDDCNLLQMNRDYFEVLGFAVFTAENEKETLEILKAQMIDCIILDIMLPGTDGYALCRKIKAKTDTPIVFLTSLSDDVSLEQGFIEGGDDFLTKPFRSRELELRVRARINEHKGISRRGELLTFGSLAIDVPGRCARIDEKRLTLTSTEFDILLLLARSPGKPFTPVEIYHEIWKLPDLDSVNTVRVRVGILRQKLKDACPEEDFIGTQWGKGYLFTTKKEKTD